MQTYEMKAKIYIDSTSEYNAFKSLEDMLEKMSPSDILGEFSCCCIGRDEDDNYEGYRELDRHMCDDR